MVNSGKDKRRWRKSIKPTKSQLHALEKLKRLDLSLHVIWGKRGIPSHLCGILSVEMEEDPEKATRKFLSEHFKLFKMKESLEEEFSYQILWWLWETKNLLQNPKFQIGLTPMLF